MKINLKIRVAALLLCLVTLFSVSCSVPLATPDTTTPPASDAPSLPANGAETVVSKTVKLYHTAEVEL